MSEATVPSKSFSSSRRSTKYVLFQNGVGMGPDSRLPYARNSVRFSKPISVGICPVMALL